MRWATLFHKDGLPPALAILLLCSGCVTSRSTGYVRPVNRGRAAGEPVVSEESISALVTAALQADALLASADSLYSEDASVVADGESREGPPRLAGVEPGGRIAITGSRIEERQRVVWMVVGYRWLSTREAKGRAGQATVILSPAKDGRWKIVHLHSSTGK